MRWCILSIAVLAVFSASLTAEEQAAKDFRTSLTEMVSQLETQMAIAHADDQPAFAAAIDSLNRIRDRESWPVVNSSVAITTLQKTRWQSAPDAQGFRQTLSFDAKGGHWHANPLSHPYGFNWLVESDRLRLSHVSPYKDSFNYQIVDRTFKYAIVGDTLTMRRGDEVLEWRRVSG